MLPQHKNIQVIYSYEVSNSILYSLPVSTGESKSYTKYKNENQLEQKRFQMTKSW